MLGLAPLNLIALHQGWIRPLVFKAIFPLVWNKNTIWWVLGLLSIAELAKVPVWFCWWKRLKPAELVRSMPNLQQQGVKKELTGSFLHLSPAACSPGAAHCKGWAVYCSWRDGVEPHWELEQQSSSLKLLSYSCSSVWETSFLMSACKRSKHCLNKLLCTSSQPKTFPSNP